MKIFLLLETGLGLQTVALHMFLAALKCKSSKASTSCRWMLFSVQHAGGDAGLVYYIWHVRPYLELPLFVVLSQTLATILCMS